MKWRTSGRILLFLLLAMGTSGARSLAPLPWKLPIPPYPYQARAKHERGVIHMEISTDKSGIVIHADASFSKKAGDLSDLAHNSVSWALSHWYGPPNEKRSVDLEYALP